MSNQAELFGPPPFDMKALKTTMRARFEVWYIQRESNPNKVHYYWTAKDQGQTSKVALKLRALHQDRKRPDDDMKGLIMSWEYILNNLPEWILDGPEMGIINSQWNRIINQILNGREQQATADNVDRYLSQTEGD